MQEVRCRKWAAGIEVQETGRAGFEVQESRCRKRAEQDLRCRNRGAGNGQSRI